MELSFVFLDLNLLQKSRVSLDGLAYFTFQCLALDPKERYPMAHLYRFVNFLLSAPMTVSMETDLAFALFDSDKDGLLSRSDFSELCIFYTGKTPPLLQLNEIWNSIDTGKRGLISKSYYQEWLGKRSQTRTLPVTDCVQSPSSALPMRCHSVGNLRRINRKKQQVTVFEAFLEWKSHSASQSELRMFPSQTLFGR